jgi:vitamin B12 transporter
MNKNFIRITACVVFVTGILQAQTTDTLSLKEVVVSDTKFSRSKEKSGKIIETISQEELQVNAGQSVAQLLSRVAGVEINGNHSTPGKNLGVYLRGGRSRQTLIMIDGVPVTDASGINLEYDLRLLPVAQVESIEIMKGAASTLYGTGAATGVINITLKKNQTAGTHAQAFIIGGTNNTSDNFRAAWRSFNQGVSFQHNEEKVQFQTALNSQEINGISQAQGENFSPDPFSAINSNSKISWTPKEKLRFDFSLFYDRLKNNYDQSFDNVNEHDSELNVSTSEQIRMVLGSKYDYQKGSFQFLNAWSRLARDYQEFNSFSQTLDDYRYQSRHFSSEIINKYNLNSNMYVISGVQFQFLDMNALTPFGDIARESTKFNMTDPYLTFVYEQPSGLNFNAGARSNNHSEYGHFLAYHVNPSYHFKNIPLKLMGSYSTAFITPSLYQLYSPFGNLDLVPEENATIELGFATSFWQKKLQWTVTGFYRDEKNSFGFETDPETFASKYVNIEGTNAARGIETSFEIHPFEKWSVRANYTYTKVEEASNRLIPERKANIAIQYNPTLTSQFQLNYQFTDQRRDQFFDGGTFQVANVQLDSYSMLNFTFRHQINKQVSFNGALNNITNENFQETIGFTTLGRNYRVGVMFEF